MTLPATLIVILRVVAGAGCIVKVITSKSDEARAGWLSALILLTAWRA